MKPVIICLSLFAIFLSKDSMAMSATTNQATIACRSDKWMTDVLRFELNNEHSKKQSYILSGKCLLVPTDVTLTLDAQPTLFQARVSFRYQGEMYWTLRDAVDLKR